MSAFIWELQYRFHVESFVAGYLLAAALCWILGELLFDRLWAAYLKERFAAENNPPDEAE